MVEEFSCKVSFSPCLFSHFVLFFVSFLFMSLPFSKVNNTHILGIVFVVSLTFDHFVS